MAKPILPDKVWWQVEPLLSVGPAREGSGRKPIPDRRALTGILFVLQTGVPWDELPYELGCGSGMSCLRRLRQWQRAGVWVAVQSLLKEQLPKASSIDWSRVHVQRNRSAAAPLDAVNPEQQPGG